MQALAKELQEVKAKNLETHSKFEKFVAAMWLPAKTEKKERGGNLQPHPYAMAEYRMNYLIDQAVVAAGMDIY